MYQGTTPLLLLEVENAELDGTTCYVTIESSTGRQITKSGRELFVSGNEIAVRLTQEETLKFNPGMCNVQVRWIDANGNAMETETAKVYVSKALLKKIIQYQEDEG